MYLVAGFTAVAYTNLLTPKKLRRANGLQEQGPVAGMCGQSVSPVFEVLHDALQRPGCSRISERLLQRAMGWSSSEIWTPSCPCTKQSPSQGLQSTVFIITAPQPLCILPRFCRSMPIKQVSPCAFARCHLAEDLRRTYPRYDRPVQTRQSSDEVLVTSCLDLAPCTKLAMSHF